MDRVLKYLAHQGRVSVICVDTKELVEEIRNIHDLTPTTTAALGRFATISGMMGFSSIKESNDTITIQLNGNGPVGSMVSTVKREGDIAKIKAYAQDPHVELPIRDDGKIDVGGAVGRNGFLNIIKKSNMTDTEYNGVIPLVSGEIAEDFTEYFAKSEQIPTVLALGVLVNKEGVCAAGGYMISLMPDATDEDITAIEKALEKAPSISQMLSENKSLDEIAKIVTGDDEVMVLLNDNMKIVYECDCSREKFETGLLSLGKQELEGIIAEDGKADLVCHFCNKTYHFDEEDLRKIIEKI